MQPSPSSLACSVIPGYRPFFELRRVSIGFGSGLVLDGINLQVAGGETVCILGRSGVGKSVSLRILLGFLKPDVGRVIVDGADITDYSEDDLEPVRKKVTMVFQNGALFDSLTIGENVAYPLRESGDYSEWETCQIVDGLLEMVGLNAMRDLLPGEISVGFKRAVAIARAMAARPLAVLYDEPTTMVDPIMARRLTTLIANLKTKLKLTSIVVTHDTRVAEKIADRLIFLDAGKVVFNGTVAEMKRSAAPVVREFLRLDQIDVDVVRRILNSRRPGDSA